MGKKGFTLVELIATIAVLAIVTTIAVSSFNLISLRIKTTAYENKVSYIETAAANYTNDTGFSATNVDNLVKLGYITPDDEYGHVIDPRDKSEMNCNVVNVTEENNNYYGNLTGTIECDIDKIDQVNMNLGIHVYEDIENPTYEDKNGIWTRENVILEPYFKIEVDISKIARVVWYNNITREERDINGDYDAKKTYKATASSIINTTYYVIITLNDGTNYQAQAQVKIDKQKPIIYSDGITIEKENEWTAKAKKVIITATDGDGSGIYGYKIISWNDRCADVDKNDFDENSNTTYETELEMGEYRACVRDNVGNIAGDGDESDGVRKIIITKIDSNPPTCDLYIKEGQLGNEDWYVSDIEIGITATDKPGESGVKSKTIDKPKITYDTDWITITGKATDYAGNVSNPCTISVKRDATEPTCSYSGESTTWTKGNRTITATCSDSMSGCVSSSSKSQTYTETAQTATFSWNISDRAGNQTTCNDSINVYIDKTPPTCSFSGESTIWTNGDRTITATCNDNNLSGCKEESKSHKYTTTTITDPFSWEISDNVGNTAICSKNVDVYVDKEPPTCSYSGVSKTWTTKNRTIEVICNDVTSGCATTDIEAPSSWSKKDPFATTRTITRTYKSSKKTANFSWEVKDNAGNTATCDKTLNVYVDKDCSDVSKQDDDCTEWSSCNGGQKSRTCTYKSKTSGKECYKATESTSEGCSSGEDRCPECHEGKCSNCCNSCLADGTPNCTQNPEDFGTAHWCSHGGQTCQANQDKPWCT